MGKCGELEEASTGKDFFLVRMEGSRRVSRRVTCYNLDAIISVGYRVNSVKGVQFRKWATNVLWEYLLKGVSFNAQYGGLAVRESTEFHDRFLIVDDKELYLIGASLKDLGKKCFAFTKLDAGAIAGLKSRVQ